MNSLLLLWFGSAIVAAIWAAYDLLTNQPRIMPVIKVAWVLIILYLGIAGLILYILSCRAPASVDHSTYVAPMWKRALGSTIHCVSGDALGIVAVAVIVNRAHLPIATEFALEYAFAFLFGWLIFQVAPIRVFMGKSLREALVSGARAEFVSLTAMVAAMFPTMYLLMGAASQSGGHMPAPTNLEFWGIMSASIAVGFVASYPASWWMVSKGWKRGMGSTRVLGAGGSDMTGTPDLAPHAATQLGARQRT